LLQSTSRGTIRISSPQAQLCLNGKKKGEHFGYLSEDQNSVRQLATPRTQFRLQKQSAHCNSFRKYNKPNNPLSSLPGDASRGSSDNYRKEFLYIDYRDLFSVLPRRSFCAWDEVNRRAQIFEPSSFRVELPPLPDGLAENIPRISAIAVAEW
jgi:hypothetical protein